MAENLDKASLTDFGMFSIVPSYPSAFDLRWNMSILFVFLNGD